MSCSPRTRTEQGVALIWAIIIMIIVMGLLVVVTMSAMSTTRDAKDSASRTRAVIWAESAGKDLVSRIESGEVGPWATPSGANFRLTFAGGVPSGTTTGARTAFRVGADTRAVPLVSRGGQRGWYQVLPPAPGEPAWSGLRIRDAGRPGDQGSIQFVVRAWHDSADAAPVLVRMEIRRNTLSRFSLLSEDQLTLGGIGSLRLGGLIHTNNTRGAGQAIQVGAGTDLRGVQRVTTTSGSITGRCPTGVCRQDVREQVSFGSASRAMDQVDRLARMTTPFARCATGRFVACSFSSAGFGTAPANSMWIWNISLNDGSCIGVRRQTIPVRTDTGGVPAVNDRVGPNGGLINVGRYCPARGGGAILLDGDAIVTGRRPGNAGAVTIMTRRGASYPRVRMGATNVPSTQPASVYLLQTGSGAGVGANCDVPSSPACEAVGIVAQGGVYLPSWAMRNVNDNLAVVNVAAMAVAGEIAYSPSIQAIASDGATPGGLGVTPDQARVMGYGFGSDLSFSGAMLSGGRMTFRYGQAGTYIGYGTRSFTYNPALTWDAPPYFPSDNDWHLADWTEFDA